MKTSPKMISFQSLAFLATIINWTTTTVDAQIQTSTKFSLLRPGEVPTSGVKQLVTAAVSSVFECAQICWNHNDSIGCGGFVYQPASCSPAAETETETCQAMQFVDLSLVGFGPATPSCQQFYVTNFPVKLSMTTTFKHIAMALF